MEASDLSASSVMSSALAFGWQIVLAVVIVAVGWVASKWAHRQVFLLAQRRSKDAMLGKFLATLVQWTILAAAAIAALGKVGVETTSLVALLASAGLAVGLALQGNLSNFASGVLILIFRPLEIGDVVQTGAFTGKVDDIGIFSSRLITPENNTVVVPNATITGQGLVNFTRRGTRRASIDVGVAYGSDLQQVREVCLAAAQASELVLEDPPVAMHFGALGASSLDFKVHCWAKNEDFGAMQDDVRSRLYEALVAAGVDIPFNQIVVQQAQPGAADA